MSKATLKQEWGLLVGPSWGHVCADDDDDDGEEGRGGGCGLS